MNLEGKKGKLSYPYIIFSILFVLKDIIILFIQKKANAVTDMKRRAIHSPQMTKVSMTCEPCSSPNSILKSLRIGRPGFASALYFLVEAVSFFSLSSFQ